MTRQRFASIRAVTLSLALITAATASPAWERYVASGRDEWIDEPSAHPLKYFKASACVDGEPYDRAGKCPAMRSGLIIVGAIGHYVIYYLNYFDDHVEGGMPGFPTAQSILVRTGPGVFHEILFRHVEQPWDDLAPPKIVSIGKERILQARSDGAGTYAMFDEDYFSFNESGATHMDPSGIFELAEKQVPADNVIYQPVTKFHFNTSTWEAGTEPKIVHGASCCTGRVFVRFKIEDGDFRAIDARYVPGYF